MCFWYHVFFLKKRNRDILITWPNGAILVFLTWGGRNYISPQNVRNLRWVCAWKISIDWRIKNQNLCKHSTHFLSPLWVIKLKNTDWSCMLWKPFNQPRPVKFQPDNSWPAVLWLSAFTHCHVLFIKVLCHFCIHDRIPWSERLHIVTPDLLLLWALRSNSLGHFHPFLDISLCFPGFYTKGRPLVKSNLIVLRTSWVDKLVVQF